MVKDFQQVNEIRSNNRSRLFLFTSSNYAHLANEIGDHIEKIFILGTSTECADRSFENIQDLIFQIAEEFAQLSKEEAHKYDESGKFTLASSKREMINNMYRQLMNISKETLADTSIHTETSIVWLTKNQNVENEKLFEISPSIVIFNDEQACLNFIVQCGDDMTIFLLVDPSPDYNSSIIAQFEMLPKIEQLYHTENYADNDKLCFRLAHDLIKYFGQLGDQLEAENRNQEAQQMFLIAKQLCERLFS